MKLSITIDGKTKEAVLQALLLVHQQIEAEFLEGSVSDKGFNYQVRSIGTFTEQKIEDIPYFEEFETTVNKSFNKAHDQNAKCKCGHPYHRHFDFHDIEDGGYPSCKYCGCSDFQKAEPE